MKKTSGGIIIVHHLWEDIFLIVQEIFGILDGLCVIGDSRELVSRLSHFNAGVYKRVDEGLWRLDVDCVCLGAYGEQVIGVFVQVWVGKGEALSKIFFIIF